MTSHVARDCEFWMSEVLTTNESAKNRDGLPPETVIFGRSMRMQALRKKLDRMASTNLPIVIQGESGTGKEVLAKLIHLHSSWGNGRFVKISCPAIPAPLLESEFFGYEKGAFTGAHTSKPGRVELADGGTLFLDEIGELVPELQAKLLHLLQDGQFSRIGAQEDRRVDVRVICSTNRSLEQDVQSGSFREDLFYRINVLNIQMPPLRERIEDLPDLVGYFVEHYSREFKTTARMVSAPTLRLMESYRWPGNIRELENLIKRHVILDSEEAITNELLAGERSLEHDVALDEEGLSLTKLTRKAVRELEKKIILKALQANNWNRKRAALALQISYRSMLNKIREAGLPPKRARST
jgi:two-component system response regulator AtoC